jgi:chromosome segregation ATPase
MRDAALGELDATRATLAATAEQLARTQRDAERVLKARTDMERDLRREIEALSQRALALERARDRDGAVVADAAAKVARFDAVRGGGCSSILFRSLSTLSAATPPRRR